MNNNTTPPVFTDQSEKKGIVLNRMYTGSYLSSNLGHEVINMFPDDNGDHYMYLNATGDFSADHVGKIGSMLLIKYAGQDEDGKPWVEVLGYATGLEDIYNPQHKKQRENDTVPCKGVTKFKDIKYGGVPICDIFKGSIQQDVLISYYANELKIPQKGIRIFLRFAPFHGKASGPVVKFAYSDNFEAVPSEFKPNIDIPKCAAYLWKETSTIGKSRLYSSKLYVVEMETKFASTSLKRYFIKDKGVSASEITKINNDLLKLASLISEEKLWRDSLEPPLPKKDSSNNKNDNNATEQNVSIFDICRIENNENCFSNALAHFMDKYRTEWCEFFKGYAINLDNKFEISREIDATIHKNSNDEADNSDGRNKKGGRIDLLLKDKDNIIIIENKIKSDINGVKDDVGEGKQLERYQKYAEWLRYQQGLDEIRDNLKKLYINSNSFNVDQKDGKVSISLKAQVKKLPRLRDGNQVEEQGKEKWRKFVGTQITPFNVYLFVLSPNYNIPHIPESCNDWKPITYKKISEFLKDKFPLSKDFNLTDFYNVIQRHIYDNICDWMRADMRNKFITRIKKLQ